jgi:hypothetical protein
MTGLKKLLLISLFPAFQSVLPAQVYIELGSAVNPRDAFGSVNVYGADGRLHSISYDQLNETPFWNPNWQKAKFYDRRDTFLGVFKARVNLLNQEVHFLTSRGVEQAVIPGELSKVIFLDETDSLKINTIFIYNIPDVKRSTPCKECFIQELNKGHTQLLKITRKQVRMADSLFGTIKVYRVVTENEYFIQHGEQYNKLRRLNKESFFTFIPGSSRYNEWIKEKGLRFNKENDYLVFLEYYNSTYKKD